MADRYTHGHDDSVLRSHRWRTAENSCRYLLDRLGVPSGAEGRVELPELRVLDVGCGPGTITIDLARRLGAQVVGVDASEGVVAQAAHAAREAGVDVEVRVGDAYRLGLPDDCVDVVHAHQMLQHLSDPVAALAEWRRVCRPGGVVAVRDADYAAMGWAPRPPELDEWRNLYRHVARAAGGDPDAGPLLPGWARQARFSVIDVSASAWCYAGRDATWWGDTWSRRVVESDFAAQARAAGVPDERLHALASAWRAWGADPAACFVIPNTEVLATP